MTIRSWFRRPKTAHLSESQVWMTLADYEAQQIAMEQLITENDQLRANLAGVNAGWTETVNEAADALAERDRARGTAVALEQDCAELEAVNARLRGRIDDLEHAIAKHGLPIPYPPLGDLAGQEALPGTDAA